MRNKAATVDEYLASLSGERRAALSAVREVVLKNLGPGFEEGMQYGMIGYFIPHSIYPPGYHCDPKQPLFYAGLASQKNHMSLHLCSAYGSAEQEQWLKDAWKKAGKKLEMGRACIRFKKLDDLPLDVVAEAFRRVTVEKYIQVYERGLASAQTAKVARKAAKTANATKHSGTTNSTKTANATKTAGTTNSTNLTNGAEKAVKATSNKGVKKGAKKAKKKTTKKGVN